MTFEIPEGKEVRLLSDVIEVVRASGKRNQLRIEGGDFALGETFYGAKRRRLKDPAPILVFLIKITGWEYNLRSRLAMDWTLIMLLSTFLLLR